jgi:regulator of sigma E protease
MSAELHSVGTHLWALFLVVVFFEGSVFVHELGHFLAARRNGMRIERFSIGFGPPIWSHRAADGVEYSLCCIPLGGYVLLPQLADLGMIEGRSESAAADLPPASYWAKMVTFVAGAVFNLLFAFVLSCVIWVVGQPVSNSVTTTRIGYVNQTVELPDGSKVPSPALAAGLRAGDVIRAIDGRSVSEWPDVSEAIAIGTGRGDNDQPRTVFTIERDGRELQVPVYPRIATFDRIRQVGIVSADTPVVFQVAAGSAAAKAGLLPGDQILSLDGRPVWSELSVWEYLLENASRPVSAGVLRGGRNLTLAFAPRPDAKPDADFGLEFQVGFHLVHLSPFAQIWEQVSATFRTLGSLLNPHSDVGLSKMSGPIGIAHNLMQSATQSGIQAVLWFTILINVNLAIFNLLPLPVLDGGQMLFATIGRLRGRALPLDFVTTAQVVFSVLLVSMIFYISVFDVRRWQHDRQVESAATLAKP